MTSGQIHGERFWKSSKSLESPLFSPHPIVVSKKTKIQNSLSKNPNATTQVNKKQKHLQANSKSVEMTNFPLPR